MNESCLKRAKNSATPSGLQFARPIIEFLGKFKYRFSYGQNMIVHTLEETKLGIAIASEVGARCKYCSPRLSASRYR